MRFYIPGYEILHILQWIPGNGSAEMVHLIYTRMIALPVSIAVLRELRIPWSLPMGLRLTRFERKGMPPADALESAIIGTLPLDDPPVTSHVDQGERVLKLSQLREPHGSVSLNC